MTALPKRKPARRTTMAAPEPEPRPAPSWEELTAPLDTSAPVIFTPAMRQESQAYSDEQRRARDADMWLIAEWSSTARENTDLLAAAGHAMAGYDGTLSEEAQAIVDHVPAMLP